MESKQKDRTVAQVFKKMEFNSEFFAHVAIKTPLTSKTTHAELTKACREMQPYGNEEKGNE